METLDAAGYRHYYLKAVGGSYRSIAHMRTQMGVEGVQFKESEADAAHPSSTIFRRRRPPSTTAAGSACSRAACPVRLLSKRAPPRDHSYHKDGDVVVATVTRDLSSRYGWPADLSGEVRPGVLPRRLCPRQGGPAAGRLAVLDIGLAVSTPGTASTPLCAAVMGLMSHGEDVLRR